MLNGGTLPAWDRFPPLSATLASRHPVAGEQNQRIDSDTFARWIEENTHTDFGRLVLLLHGSGGWFHGTGRAQSSVASTCSLGQKCVPQAEHPDAELIHGGAGQVPEKIAAELGSRIRLSEPVLCIHHHEIGVEIETARNRFAARFTVVATPPHLPGQIRYDLPLHRCGNNLPNGYRWDALRRS
jgi:L-amino acid dehydrogenase